MSYQAAVVNIMIAGPSDVEQELQFARDGIYEWNDTDAEQRRVVALPIGWKTHSTPRMGERPQAIINRDVLQRADMLVAVLRARLGTPTDEYLSGTEEEIKRSIAEKRPTMVYFSDSLPNRDELDHAQFQRVEEFREWLKPQGLYRTFADHHEFRKQFTADLRKAMNDFANSLSTPQSQDLPRVAVTLDERLSEKAKELLVEASQDDDALVLYDSSMQGLDITTNGKSFCLEGDPRSEAEGREAVEELVGKALLEVRGIKGELFKVTAAGFRVADALRKCLQGFASSSPEYRENALSDEAKKLLYAMKTDPDGAFTRHEAATGKLVMNTKTEDVFDSSITNENPREKAKWLGALDALLRAGLIQDRTGGGEIFSLTNAGWEAADGLALS